MIVCGLQVSFTLPCSHQYRNSIFLYINQTKPMYNSSISSAQNASFSNSLQWSIRIINSVDKTKLSKKSIQKRTWSRLTHLQSFKEILKSSNHLHNAISSCHCKKRALLKLRAYHDDWQTCCSIQLVFIKRCLEGQLDRCHLMKHRA